MKLSKRKRRLIKIVFTLTLLCIIVGCSARYYYTPSVMPTGKGELKKKQIRRDFTN
jgi:hypothetical protein